MTNIVWRCTRADVMWQPFLNDENDEELASTRQCTCSAFEYNGSCAHIDIMRSRFCTWTSDGDRAKPLDVGPPPRCPECQGPVAAKA